MQTPARKIILQHVQPHQVRSLVIIPDFWNQHFDTPLPEGKVDFRYLLPDIALDGGVVNNRFVLAHEQVGDERKLVGVLNYMCSYKTGNPTIFLDKVCVHQEHRGQGLANKMIEVFQRRSAEAFPRATGWFTFPLGDAARHLAQKMGFRDVSHMVAEQGMKGMWAKVLSVSILLFGTWNSLPARTSRNPQD